MSYGPYLIVFDSTLCLSFRPTKSREQSPCCVPVGNGKNPSSLQDSHRKIRLTLETLHPTTLLQGQGDFVPGQSHGVTGGTFVPGSGYCDPVQRTDQGTSRSDPALAVDIVSSDLRTWLLSKTRTKTHLNVVGTTSEELRKGKFVSTDSEPVD